MTVDVTIINPKGVGCIINPKGFGCISEKLEKFGLGASLTPKGLGAYRKSWKNLGWVHH